MSTKKILMIVVVAVLMCAGPVMAPPPPTIVNVNWNQAGLVNIDVVSSDDFHSVFNLGSNFQVTGQYLLTDLEDNPYTYGVDTITAQVEASVAGGGFMTFDNTRTDSWVPTYGNAGENSYTNIVTDATAQLQFRTGGNYANLQSCNYSWHSNDHFQATGNFDVYHSLQDDTGEGAYIWNIGSGSTDIDLMSESTWGGTGSFTFGKGCGCYTNADVVTTGSGWLQVYAIAENQINVDALPMPILGDGTLGSAIYDLQITYGTGLNFPNFALDGN